MSTKDAAFGTGGFRDDRHQDRHRRPAARAGLLLLAAATLCAGLLSTDAVRAQTGKDAIDDAFWDSVKDCTAPAEVKAYIEEFSVDPDAPKTSRQKEGRHLGKARECLAWLGLDLGSCNDIGDIGPIREFLSEFPRGKHAPEARECRDRLEQLKRVADLLNECRAHRAGGRLTSGIVGNALDCYRRLLEADPGNKQALAGIADIVKHYADKAASELQRERPASAEQAIGQLAKIAPEHPQVEPLKAQLQALKERIDARKRLNATLDALRREVEALLAKGEPEEAQAVLEAAKRRGLSGKTMEELGEKVQAALKETAVAAKVAEARSLLDRGDVAGARRALDEARSMGMEKAAARDLEEAIAAADRAARLKAALAEFDDLIGKGDLTGARAALEQARGLGLSEAGYQEREKRLRDRDIDSRMAVCKDHLNADRTTAALDCYRKIREEMPEHAAAAQAALLLAAWKEVERANTVDGYSEFERAHPGSTFAKLARQRLKNMEVAYWKSAVVTSGTRAAYARYLEIFPEGPFAPLAKLRLVRSN